MNDLANMSKFMRSVDNDIHFDPVVDTHKETI